jgi:hypothetical protein
MNYLNFERLNQIDPEVFREQKPYPWINLDIQQDIKEACDF